MKKDMYIYFDAEGNKTLTTGSWAKRNTLMDMDAVCSETYETEYGIYHYQPEYRKEAIEYINSRAVPVVGKNQS